MKNITIISVFIEGVLSFFSPCVLPMIPLYLSYIASDAVLYKENGEKKYKRLKVFLNTVFFVLGVSTVYFLMGFGITTFHTEINKFSTLFTLIGGILLLFSGLKSIGFIQIPILEKEYKINTTKINNTHGILKSWLFGFLFSFAWSPCIGPILSSVIIMVAGAETKIDGYLYILVYIIGFMSLFLVTGLFTEEMFSFFKKHRNIVKYTEKIAGVIIIAMSVWMFSKIVQPTLNNTDKISEIEADSNENQNSMINNESELQNEEMSSDGNITENSNNEELENTTDTSTENKQTDIEKFNFSLKDANGTIHNLLDYKGKKIIVNFFGTWCQYCNKELPVLQEINDSDDDIVILLIATPNFGSEGSIDYVENYMKEKGYSMTILYDENPFAVTMKYGISGYPTSFFYNTDGSIYGYAPGYLLKDNFMEIVSGMK